jgi:hypothetical protein
MQLKAPIVPLESVDQSHAESGHWVIITGITLLALGLRLYQIGAKSLWNDEWLSLRDAAQMAQHNLHRPLFYLLLRPWLSSDHGDAWVRLPAVFFGVVAIVLLYFLGRRLADAPAALMGCLIMAIAMPEVDRSQEVRMYTMASALTLASLYALVQWVETDRIWWLAVHVLLTYLAFLTTPTVIAGLMLAAGMVTVLLLYRRNWTAVVTTLIGYGLIVAAWWPLERHARMAVKAGSLDWIPRPPPSALLSLHGELLTEGLGAMRGFQPSQLFQLVLSMLALGLVAIALMAAWRRQPGARQAGFVAAWFYGIAVGMYATSVLKRPVWVLRYFHYASPALYLLLGIGIVSLWRRFRSAGAIAAIALLGFMGLAAADYFRLPVREDWRGAATVITNESTPEDIIGVVGLAGLFERYYRGPSNVRAIWPDDVGPQLAKMPQQSEAVLADLLRQVWPHTGRTWIVVREDPRFERVAFLKRFDEYLRRRGISARIRIFPTVFPTVQGQLDIIDFIMPVADLLAIPPKLDATRPNQRAPVNTPNAGKGGALQRRMMVLLDSRISWSTMARRTIRPGWRRAIRASMCATGESGPGGGA